MDDFQLTKQQQSEEKNNYGSLDASKETSISENSKTEQFNDDESIDA